MADDAQFGPRMAETNRVMEDKVESAKDKYVEKRKSEIDKWNVELAGPGAKIVAADAESEAKLKHKEHVAVLRQKRDKAGSKPAEIHSAGDDRWESFKDGLDNVWKGLKDDFEKGKANV